MTLSHRFSWLASTGPVFSRKYWFSRSASACRAGYKSDWPLYCGPLMTGIWQIMILLESIFSILMAKLMRSDALRFVSI